MIRSLFTASSGLRGHQRFLDVVGNNLANVSTTGFKAQRLRFSDQFSQTLRAHTLPNGALGGTNPIQVGNGVKAAAVDTLLTQGSLEQTGNALDLAIQGNGFFVVNNGVEDLYTRAGAFSVDGQGFLVDSSTGNRVQRVGVVGEGSPVAPAFQQSGTTAIRIPNGQTIPGRATTRVQFQGNLDGDRQGPQAEQIVINTPLTIGTGATTATLTTPLNSLDQTTALYGAGDQILITGTNVDGSSVNAQFVATNGTETVGDLINAITAAFGGTDNIADPSPNGATAILVDGRIVLTANRTGPSSLTMNLSSSDTTPGSGETTFNNFIVQTEGRDGDEITTAIEVFDDQGAAHTLTFTFQKQGLNVWDMISAVDPSGNFFARDAFVQGLTFNEDGSFQAVTGTDRAEVISTTRPFTTGGTTASTAAALATTQFNALDQTTTAFSAGDELLITATDVDGNQFTDSFTFTTGNETLGDLVNFLNGTSSSANISQPLGATAEIVGGQLRLTADLPGPAELSLSIAVNTAASTGRAAFDDLVVTTEGTDGDDSIEFEINSLTGFGTPQTVQFDFGQANTFDRLTQFGGFASVAAFSQDGFAPGSLTSVAVSSDGVIQGVFSNGQSHSLAQLAVATFANPEALDRVADNNFADNGNSGPAILAPALTNGAGSVQNSVLENSNVDISFEFTQLITAQRGFQVNARSFTTASEVLEEAVNLVR